MSGAIRTQQLYADSDGVGLSPERFEELRTMKAFIGELERWRERRPDESFGEETLALCLRKAEALLSEEREGIRSGRALHAFAAEWARSRPEDAAVLDRFEESIVRALLGTLTFKHATVSVVESLRAIVFEPMQRLDVALSGRERETWQVVEALCLIMDARIHNEADVLAKLDEMERPQFELTQRLLRRLLWDHLDYPQFRRVVYAFYVRHSSRRSKLGYAEYEYAEMLSYVYDFGQTSMAVYEFMAWKAANPLRLPEGYREAIAHFFEFEGHGMLSEGAVRKTLLKSNNAEFNALVRDIRLEQAGVATRFLFKHWGKLTVAIAAAGLAALGYAIFA